MIRVIAPVIGLFVSIALTTTAAQAVSCTQQGASCRTWAAGQGTAASTYVAKCNAEIGSCIARCKAGNKVFIGVYSGAGGGQHYPIDACK